MTALRVRLVRLVQIVRLVLVVLCSWATVAAAQNPGLDAPPPPEAPRAVPVPALHELRLANGLRVVVAAQGPWPLVSATLLVRSGPEADPVGRAGLAATTVALLGQGARRAGIAAGASTLAAQAEALGGELELSSTWRASTLGMTVMTPKLDAALALLADVARQPLLAGDGFERVRARMQGELRITRSDPTEVALLAARRAFWADTRYAATPTAASLRRLTTGEVRAFHRRWYRPDHAVLVLVGDIGPERARQLAEHSFGDWRAPPTALAGLPPPDVQAAAERLLLIDMPGSGQSSVLLVLPFGAVEAEQRAVALVANAVLGLGYSSRLNQQVRIRRGLSYGVSSQLEMHPEASLLSAQAQTRSANAAAVLDLLRSELDRMAEEPPPPEELAARRAILVGAFARQLDTVGGLNQLIVGQLAQDQPLAALDDQVSRLMAVTPEQVHEFVRRQWPMARVRAVVAGDARAGGAALRDLDPQARPIPLHKLELRRSEGQRPAR